MIIHKILFFLLFLYFIQSEKEENNNNYDLNKINKFICENPEIDCNNNGKCSDDKNFCICNEGYQTYFTDFSDYINNKPRCNYKSKKQLTALIFSLFLSFGSLHFYLGNKILGYIQLITFIFIFTFNSIFIYKLSIKHLHKLNRLEIKNSFTIILFIILFSFIFIFWYCFDIIMIYFNIYRDENNANLYNII